MYFNKLLILFLNNIFPNFMLLKNNRVQRKLFPTVLKSQKKYNSKHMFVRVVLYNHKTKTPTTKVSFVVSKKNTKTAVQRHKIRRLGYNTIKEDLSKIKKGFLIVFFFTKNVDQVSKEDLKKEIKGLLKRANLYI